MRLLGDSENPEKSRNNLKIKNYDVNTVYTGVDSYVIIPSICSNHMWYRFGTE